MKIMEMKKGKRVISSLLLGSMLCYTMPVFALTKEETVYSKLNTEGSSYQTIISDHIKNDELLSIIEDMSDLLNVKNTSGDETFSKNEDTVIWNAGENDIYYQGETTKQLPIETTIKYELDGKEISAKDIAGKTGKVKITISYNNKDEHTVSINGKKEVLYTPFITITGVAINNENNKNISITNGKTIEKDGDTIAIGIAFPGLQQSLGIDKEKIEIPETIEISMDATDFELNNMLTYITPRVLEDDELGITDQINDLYDAVNKMEDASQQIEEGALTLKDGTAEYNEKSNEFSEYMKQLADGTASAENGAKTLLGGVKQLSSKSKALVPGVTQLANGSKQLKNGIDFAAQSAQQLADGASSANSGMSNISKGIDGLYAQLSQIDTNAKIEQITQLINADKKTKLGLEQINSSLEIQIKENSDNEELVELLKQQETLNVQTIKVLEQNISANEQSKSSLQSIEQVKAVISQIKVGIDGTSNNQGLKDGINSLSTNLTALAQGLATIDENTSTLVDGTGELAASAGKLIDGINTLQEGTTELSTGLSTVNTSTNTLYSASTQLADGSKTISEGMATLTDGIQEFNDEAISKISNYVNIDLKNIVDRVESLNDLSKDYINFSMIDEKMNGNVKFILMTDSIKKDKED